MLTAHTWAPLYLCQRVPAIASDASPLIGCDGTPGPTQSPKAGGLTPRAAQAKTPELCPKSTEIEAFTAEAIAGRGGGLASPEAGKQGGAAWHRVTGQGVSTAGNGIVRRRSVT